MEHAADSDDVKRIALNRFATLFGAPDVPNPVEFKAEYIRALSGTEVGLLNEAITKVIDEHEYRNWPTIGECRAAIASVGEERAAVQRRREAYGLSPAAPQPTQQTNPEMQARIAAMVKETVAKLKVSDEAMTKRRAEWAPTDRNAWAERMRTSQTARWLSLPKEYRESFGSVGEFMRSEERGDLPPTGKKLSEVGRFDDLPSIPEEDK